MADQLALNNGILTELQADAQAIREGKLDIEKARALNGVNRNRLRAAEVLLQCLRMARQNQPAPSVIELIAGPQDTAKVLGTGDQTAR